MDFQKVVHTLTQVLAKGQADGNVAADGEAPSWFRRPRLPRAQRAMLARRMMALTKAIIG